MTLLERTQGYCHCHCTTNAFIVIVQQTISLSLYNKYFHCHCNLPFVIVHDTVVNIYICYSTTKMKMK
jgi:hypothetical protein